MSVKTVLITGAAQGIGNATARLLAERGYRLIIADLNGDAAKAVAVELNKTAPTEGGHYGFELDVTDEAQVEASFNEVEKSTPGLYALINSAGNLIRSPAETMEPSVWQSQIDTHISGTFNVTQAAFGLLTANSGASIVNIASVGSTFGLPGRAAYSTAKSGIVGMTRTLAVEWGKHSIRVNAVAPGYVNTAMVRSGLESGTLDAGKLLGRTPLGRLAEPIDIAKAIAFLISDDASFVQGEVLKVDGGLTIDGSF